MGILLDGFRKQKRYTTNANGDHQLVSTWTHSDTVIMPDGTPLSEAVLGDGNDAVRQTETVNGNDNYEILLSQTADDTTRIEGARKSSKLKFNPYTSSLMMTTRNGQSTLTPNQLTISGVGGEGSLTNNTLVLSNNGISTTYSNSDIVTDNHNTWDGTNTSLKAAIAAAASTGGGGVAVPPVIFDNGNLKKVNDVDGFPGLEKVFLTPNGYEALTQAEKENLSKIYYVSEYDYYSDKGGTLVLRVKNDEIKLFVNGFVDENTELKDGNFVGIINDKIRELKGRYFIGSIAYNENKEPKGGSLPYVYIDANYSIIAFRNASGDSSHVINTTTYAVIDLTNYSQGQGSVLQSNPWEDPYDISGGMTIYYGGKQYSNFDIPDPLPSVTSSDNGKVLKVVSGVWSKSNDEGGSEAVYKTLAEYEALPTAEKEDPTKIYFVINEGTKVSPTLSADDGNFTVSSAQSGYDPWKVFDGSTRTDNKDYEYCYSPWGQHNGEWIAYSFGTKHVFSKVHIRAATLKAHTMNYYIEGSNDGETWTGLIFNADYVSVSHLAYADAPSYVETDILLDTSKGKFSKIRFRQDLSIGYPYSSDKFSIANWDIFAAAASNKPSIYYKNVLYNPDELPVTTISDAGKVLKVNEDGLWDKGDAPIPDVNAVQVPPVIFDNGNLKKVNNVDGFPGLEKVFLTPTGYEALTQTEKEDLSKIYYVADYEFYSSNDGTVVIRLNGDRTERLCFFNGFIDNFNSVTPYANFPEELRDTWTTYYSGGMSVVASTEYDENGNIRSGRYFGIRYTSDWHVNDMDASQNNFGPKNRANYAVLDMTSSTVMQSNPWVNPYDIPNGMTIYYGGKQYTEYEPAKPYVELTQSEYDALPSSKESDGIIYFING